MPRLTPQNWNNWPRVWLRCGWWGDFLKTSLLMLEGKPRLRTPAVHCVGFCNWASRNVVSGPAESTSPGGVLEMRILRPGSRWPQSDPHGGGPSNLGLSQPQGGSPTLFSQEHPRGKVSPARGAKGWVTVFRDAGGIVSHLLCVVDHVAFWVRG